MFLVKFKSHRESVDCLWQPLTAVHVRVCEYMRGLVTIFFFFLFFPPHNASVGLSRKTIFPPRTTSCSSEGARGQSGIRFCQFLSDVAPGFDRNAAGRESLPSMPLIILCAQK